MLLFLLDPAPCEALADVLFVMDATGSIGETNFTLEKKFVKQVARGLGISPTLCRAGLVVYNTTAFFAASFDDYSSLPEFERAVEILPDKPKGYTRIDKALKKADEIFSNARKGVAKIAIVLTDGKQEDPNAVNDPIIELDIASEPLRKKGVEVWAVGIGKEVDESELRLMVKSKKNLILPNDFNELNQKVNSFRRRICGKKMASCLYCMCERDRACFCVCVSV